MATLRFLPQATLDLWAEQGKADLLPGRLVDLATREELTVREAVRIVGLESGEDAQGLLNKVKDLEQVQALGAERCQGALILGETVYSTVAGWLVEDPTAPEEPKPSSEADLLARLLLDKLA